MLDLLACAPLGPVMQSKDEIEFVAAPEGPLDALTTLPTSVR